MEEAPVRPRWDMRRYSTPRQGGHVADRVERAIVRDDLDQVAGPGAAEPHSRAHRDAQVAPVLHPGGRGAVHEVGAAPGEQPGAVRADHPPVPDRDQVDAAVLPVDGQVVQDAAHVVGAARVLHVHEDRAAPRRQRRARRRRLEARREPPLGRGGSHRRKHALGLGGLHRGRGGRGPGAGGLRGRFRGGLAGGLLRLLGGALGFGHVC